MYGVNIKGSVLDQSPIITGNGNTVITSYSGDKTLNNILKDINKNLSEVKEEDAEKIRDVIELAKTELQEFRPKKGRLRNCVTLLESMFAIANGFPELTGNLHKLKDYITLFTD